MLLLATTLSRAALWASDLLQRQIVQVQAGERRMKEFALQDALGQGAACCMYLLAASGVEFSALCCASALSVTLAAVLLALKACRVTAGNKGNSHHLALLSEDYRGSKEGLELLGQNDDISPPPNLRACLHAKALWEFDERQRLHTSPEIAAGNSADSDVHDPPSCTLALVREDCLGAMQGHELGRSDDTQALWEFDIKGREAQKCLVCPIGH